MDVSLSVEQQRVANIAVSSRSVVGTGALPNDLVPEVFVAENLIHQYLHVMDRVPIQMNVDASCWGEKLFKEEQPGAEH